MSPIVLTNCTARKSRGPTVPPLAPSAWRSVDHAAATWWGQVSSATDRQQADAVYQGRSVQEAKACAQQLGAELWFVSAGLGLVHASQRIPRYDLSLAQGTGAIAPLLKALSASPADWWRSLSRRAGQSLADLAMAAPGRPIYIALPSTYLQLIAGDLEVLAATEAADRLWIFSAPAGVAGLPSRLAARALPYDQRLAGAGLAGTQADFPQRCLRHFLSLGLAPTADAEVARRAVGDALAAHVSAPRKRGRAASDSDVLALLRTHWQGQGGQSSKLLRLLRGELAVACEQGRFQRLYHRVRTELGEGT